MATVVQALNRIARQCSVTEPDSWVTASALEHKELRDDFMIETVENILERLDLPAPFAQTQTLTGTGTANADGSETFTLNSNFLRVQRSPMAVYENTQNRQVVPISDDGEWLHLTQLGSGGVVKSYRIAGYEGNWTIDIYPAPATGSEITLNYISTNWMVSSGGMKGSAFTDETDILLLPNRIVEAGTVWRFRERKGLPFADKMNEYEMLLARLSNDTRGRRVIGFGETDRTTKWQDLVPAFIPSS